jgi:DNA processing protein
MTAEMLLSIDNDILKPSIEIGAFEALWANKDVSSFKQLHEKFQSSNAHSLSDLIEPAIAREFYEKTVTRLHDTGIHHFGVRLAGTVDYPKSLRDADYPLPLLYYVGNWDLVFSRGVSVVGTRNPSPNGINRTRRLVKGLVDAGYTIYSGLAAGIDRAAHQATIEAGGSTVAVIGTPLWLRYPKENAELYDIISRDHLLISQVPVVSYVQKDIKFNRFFFPERNKTMSALSEATIIVEAGETSGTLIQAKAALKQGRKVLILNSNFENAQLTWPHRLLEAGAKRVCDVDDIFQELLNGRDQATAD